MINGILKVNLSLTLILLTAASFAQRPFVHSGQSKAAVDYDMISFLGAGDSARTYAQAKTYFDQSSFIINRERYLNFGIARDDYWISFKVVNSLTEPKELFVALENPRLNEVMIYQCRKDSLSVPIILGDNFPFHARSIHTNQFIFPVTIAETDTVTLLLFLKHRGNTLQLPISIMDRNGLLVKAQSNYLLMGAITGVFSVAFVFGVFFWAYAKDSFFFFYSCYILSCAVWAWGTEGFAFQYLFPNSPELATRFGPGVSTLSSCCFLMATLLFCRPYDSRSLFRKLFLILISGLAFLGLSALFMPIELTESIMRFFLTASFLLHSILIFSILLYLGWLTLQGHKTVTFYLIATLVTIVSFGLSVAWSSGIIFLPLSSGNLMSIAHAVEIVLMTAGITWQFYVYRKEKESALEAYLEQQKSFTDRILQTQDTERNRISRDLHDNLGSKLTMLSHGLKKLVDSSAIDQQKIQSLYEHSDSAIFELRESIWGINKHEVTAEEFIDKINTFFWRLKQQEETVIFKIDTENVLSGRTLHATEAMNLFRILQEAVNNTLKHARATVVDVRLTVNSLELNLFVCDNGSGFTIAEVNTDEHYGLANMRKRAVEIKGELTIDSHKEKGTSISIVLPLNGNSRYQ